MTQTKTSRAFRTISEAADELDLQSHVLRFWESKFSDIQPMKRRGGRRFYRPEDIEFLRGIKILLHREKHPIKDVQKLIRIRGAQSVRDLGRSIEQAAKPRAVKDTNLVPKRIKPVVNKPVVLTAKPAPVEKPVEKPDKQAATSRETSKEVVRRPGFADTPITPPANVTTPKVPAQSEASSVNVDDKPDLKDALSRLKSLRSRWQEFT